GCCVCGSVAARHRRCGGAREARSALPRRARAGRGAGAGGDVRGAARRRPARRRRRGGSSSRGTMVLNSLRGRDFLRIRDFTRDELESLLDLAAELKAHTRPLLPQKTLGLYFAQPSTRTRISFSVAIAQLGGTPVVLLPQEMQLARGESLEDTAHVRSRYVDALAIRTLSHGELEAWAEAASIPVINALTSEEHPCQALADVLTIRERLGSLEDVRIAWVGDGTNVLDSLADLATIFGAEVVAACPAGYEPASTNLSLVRDPHEAAEGADVLVTDIWVSLGQEAERATRLRDLEPYRLDESLLGLASPEALVLHCLPAHPGEEISPGAIYGEHSAVWDEAENRLHVQKALLALLVG